MTFPLWEKIFFSAANANAASQSFNAGGPGGFGASGSSANAASQSFNGEWIWKCQRVHSLTF